MVTIKDFKLPLNCGECSLVFGSDRDWFGHCPFLQETKDDIVDNYYIGNERHPKCPLLELK